jgi:catalase
MAYYVDGGGENPHVNYEPSSMGGLREAPKPKRDYHQHVEGHLGRYQTSRTADDYKQAGERYRSFEDWEREDLINNLVDDMKQCPEHIALRMVWHFWHCDEDYGRRVAEGAGIDLEKAKRLPPLEGKPAPHQRRSGPTYTDGRPEGGSTGGQQSRQREPVPAK